MLAATEITAKNIDPQQRWIMRLLPIGVTIFLWNFPAGLFVYWITSNLVTLVQNYVIYHHGPGKKSPAVEAGKAGSGKNILTGGSAPGQNGSEQRSDPPQDAESRAAKTAKRKRRKKKK
jgi:YidC/Oxa1 family membrane protein insertase